MDKIKQGKMDRPIFWLVIIGIVLFELTTCYADTDIGDALGKNGRLVAVIIAETVVWVACGMRLRDAGKSLAHLIIMFFLHIYVIAIGCYKSEELHSIEEPERIKEDTENMNEESCDFSVNTHNNIYRL